ncbi:MAG: hypothetical protein PHR77_02395 [Kiritimatiellae bacterium]|nr:hypothetical protein [Kiritimatiellia bacterium]MDD5519867.1 hypothetical protein [Kiritimatiellia bacterium]
MIRKFIWDVVLVFVISIPYTLVAADNVTVKWAKGKQPATEAFPEMRKLWDREPPAPSKPADERTEKLFRVAEKNGRSAAEGLYRCRKYVDGWIIYADPETGLIPRGLGKGKWLHGVNTSDVWNGRDAGADNYAFMVLTCAITDRTMFEGRMLDILKAEIKYCSRVDRLGDNYCFSTRKFVTDQPILDEIIFDNAEYVKDGLIPLTEWLGKSPWSDRAVALIEDIWKNASVDTPFGKIPTLNFEVNGDLLQACSRFYWFTGERKFLDWAIRLGDYYLLGDHHPTRNMKELRLRDHGCEVINGLTELYAALKHAQPEKAETYRKPIHDMFDRILAVGRNEHGMLYNSFNPQTGEHGKGICDTWGYNYDGFYTVYLLDKTETYRDAVRQAMGNLQAHYTNYLWEGQSSDGYADSVESGINLYNREPIASTAGWIDSEIRVMWAKQHDDGVIEGWHGDGNFARTTVMYVLWKTQGIRVEPWRPDVRIGTVREGDTLFISLAVDQPWSGKVVFDQPRHKVNLHMPIDYPRINQFPEWFTVEDSTRYEVKNLADSKPEEHDGKEMSSGIPVTVPANTELRLTVKKKLKDGLGNT